MSSDKSFRVVIIVSFILSVFFEKSATWPQDDQSEGKSSKQVDSNSYTPDVPNLVEISGINEPQIDIRKLQHMEFAKRRTREELVFDYIAEDPTFNVGEEVVQWAHVWHNGSEYFVGRRQHDVQIVRLKNTVYSVLYTLDVGQRTSDMIAYSFWNVKLEMQEAVLLVAASDKVFWYRVHPETKVLELKWVWNIGRYVSGLTYFTIDSNEYLALSTHNSSRRHGQFIVYIYEFVLDTQEFWIAQRLPLRHSCAKATFFDTGRDVVFAVPQLNKAAVYTFNPRESDLGTKRIQFQFLRNYDSKDISSVAAFKMGGSWYLAMGGRQPKILVYQQGDFVPRTILGETFGLVELFFPIPLRTYRDDLILLVQRRVDFSTHFIIELEALIWNGEYFETSIPMPCHQGQHTMYGVGCILDLERDFGIIGAAIRVRKSKVALLVPRHEVPSGLFYIHTKMLVRNSEYHDLQESYSFLKEWVTEHDDLYALAQEFIRDDAGVEAAWSKLDSLETPELTTGADIGDLYINDYLWNSEDVTIDLDEVLLKIQQLGDEFFEHQRQKRAATEDELEFDVLELDEVDVDELLIEALNNEEFYMQDGGINFKGVLNAEILKVVGALPDESSDSQTFFNLNFEEINGLNWKEIEDGLVFRDQPLTLDELTLKGEMVVEDDLTISSLNDLKYPEDFLWSSGLTNSVVRGEKTFSGTLAAGSLDTDGFINGAYPSDAITLSKAQNWTGSPTFANLEVSQISQFNDDSNNYTLANSNLIQSDCSFTQLEVHGSIVLLGQYGSNNLSEVLTNIIRRPATPDTQVQISSPKKFSSIELPIDSHLHEESVNNISIKEFVTLHNKQELNITTLNGYVYFNNLTMENEGSTFDGVDIVELQRNAIKIDEPVESPNTQLNMIQNPTLKAKFDVRNSLNGNVIATSYQTIYEDLHVKEVTADELHAPLAEISGDIQGQGRLNGRRLQELLASNFPKKDGKLLGDEMEADLTESESNILLNELILQGGLTTDKLQGFEAQNVLAFLDDMDSIPDKILAGKIEVDAVVTGDVQVNKLNGDQFDEEIQLAVVWLNRTNFITGKLVFTDPLYIDGDVYSEGSLNGQSLPDLLDDIVFRNAHSTKPHVISATKRFMKDVIVNGNTKVDALNGLPFQNIATKRHVDQTFNGTVRLNGNLFVEALTVSGYLNGESTLNNLSDMVHYDRQLRAFVLRGETVFNNRVRVQDLTVQGNLNNLRNISAFFQSLVYKNKVCLLKGKKTFTGRVSIEGGAYVRSLNGYNLLVLLNNIVMVNEGAGEVIEIKSPVTFRAPVSSNLVVIVGDLQSNTLNGCSLLDWVQDTLRVDRGENITGALQFKPGALNSNSLSVRFVNELEMSRVITLHTPQHLNSSLSFSELHLDGTLTTESGLVNGVDLQTEYANTLLVHGNQHVTTPLTMQSCRVLQTLRTNASVNRDRNLHEVATLQESLEFRSPLFLQNISARRVFTNDLVSGINLDEWHRSALWTQNRPQQWITGNWSAHTLSTREAPNRRNILPDLSRSVRTAPRDKNFIEVCQQVADLVKASVQRVSFIKYIEEAPEIELGSEKEKILKAYPFTARGTNYLLLNFGCFSSVYKWINSTTGFQHFTKFESGFIDQLLLVATPETQTMFVTNTAENREQYRHCRHSGLNSWALDNVSVKHFLQLGQNYSRIYKPREFSSVLYAEEKQNELIHAFSSIHKNVPDKWHLRVSNDEEMFQSAVDLNVNKAMDESSKNRADLGMEDHLEPYQLFPKLKTDPIPLKKPAIELDIVEFQKAVEDVLQVLSRHLNVQVDITQLSIPESDLYDVNLLKALMDVLQEMQKQRVLPDGSFLIDMKTNTLKLPSNPAEVLAAQSVLYIWPAMAEIEKLQEYLKETEYHTIQPWCASIRQTLAEAVRDVLHMAYQRAPIQYRGIDYMDTLMVIIEYIRELQKKLLELLVDTNTGYKREVLSLERQSFPSQSNEEPKSMLGDVTIEFTTEPNETNSSSDTKSGRQHQFLNKVEKKNAVTIEVGPAEDSRLLNVVYLSIAGKNVCGIELYTNRNLLQTIVASKPRDVVSLRIRDETVLAFVEDCCTVRVFIYRGIQGFVELVNFTLPERVQNLNVLQLQVTENAQQRHFITVNMGHKIRFYEVILAGDKTSIHKEILCK